MNKEQLENYINQGLSSYQIATLLNKSQGSVLHWLKKFNLKTKHRKFQKGMSQTRISSNMTLVPLSERYNWKEIQEYYDSGKTWNDIISKYKITITSLSKAVKQNLFKTRTPHETLKLKGYKNPPLSQEAKNKLSIARKNYLKSNNFHRWHNKSSHHSSWFCESVKNKLKQDNVIFSEEYMPLKHINRFFALDIAFPELKIGFELNGRQHYNSSGQLLPYYQNRHDLIVQNGWKLFEIPYSTDINKIVSFIKENIKEQNYIKSP